MVPNVQGDADDSQDARGEGWQRRVMKVVRGAPVHANHDSAYCVFHVFFGVARRSVSRGHAGLSICISIKIDAEEHKYVSLKEMD